MKNRLLPTNPLCCGKPMHYRQHRTAQTSEPIEGRNYKVTSAVFACGDCQQRRAVPENWREV